MLQTPPTTRPRPSLSAIKRALPAVRCHLLFRLMPYSYSAPREYGDLQTLVHECLIGDDPSRHVTALTSLLELFDTGLEDVPRRHHFIAEIASHIQARRFSCVAAEAEFVAMLDMVDVALDEIKGQRGTVGVPMLVGKVQWHKGQPTAIRRALPVLLNAVDKLTSFPTQVLEEMPARERMAGIRLLRLFCLFGQPAERAPVQEARLHFLRTLAIPVWHVLAAPGFDELSVDPGVYGEPAIHRLGLALSDGTYAASESSPSGFSMKTPEADASGCVFQRSWTPVSG